MSNVLPQNNFFEISYSGKLGENFRQSPRLYLGKLLLEKSAAAAIIPCLLEENVSENADEYFKSSAEKRDTGFY